MSHLSCFYDKRSLEEVYLLSLWAVQRSVCPPANRSFALLGFSALCCLFLIVWAPTSTVELGLARETEQDFNLANTSRGSLTEVQVLHGSEKGLQRSLQNGPYGKFMAQADKSRKKLSGGIIFCKVFLCCVLRTITEDQSCRRCHSRQRC